MCKASDCFIKEMGYWISKENKKFNRNVFLPSSLTDVVINQRNNKGVFETTYSYNTEKQDEAFLYGDLYLDFDSTDFEKVRKDALKAISYFKIVFKIKDVGKDILIFFSGNKGLHIIIPAETLGVEPTKTLNITYKIIAESISNMLDYKTLDMQIYDNKRMFRIPNSIHESTNLHKVYITYDELRTLSEEEVKKIAETEREIPNPRRMLNRESHSMFNTFIDRTETYINSFKNIKSSLNLKYTPPCIESILEEGAKSGSRNNIVALLASFYKSCGKDSSEAIDAVELWNDEKNSSPLSVPEIRRTVQSIYSNDKLFGCSAIRAMDLCIPKECKFKKGEK